MGWVEGGGRGGRGRERPTSVTDGGKAEAGDTGWLPTGWALRHRLAHGRHHVDEEGEARRVHGGHDDGVERRVGDVAVAGEALAPVHEPPRAGGGGVGLDAVVEDEALVGELDVGLGPLGAPPLGESLAVVLGLVRRQGAAEGPDGRELEVGLVDLLLLGVGLVEQPRGVEQPPQQVAQLLDEREVHERRDALRLAALEPLEHDGHVLLEELLDHELGLRVELRVGAERVHPRLHVRPPADVGLVEVEHAAARRGGGRGVAHVRDLEEEAHALGEWDALVGDERQHAVVVHDGVHALNPLGVDVTVEHDPLVARRLALGEVAHDLGNDAVVGLLGHRVHVAVELVRGDCLWVERRHLGHATVGVDRGLRARERLPHLRLG